jgi:hypothetical protein
MSGASVAAKVKKGLHKANKAVGENPNAILKEVKALTGGDGITPPTETITTVQLVDAIFKSYNQNAIDGTSVKAGDRQLVSNGDITIEYGNIITEGSDRWLVVGVDNKTPAGVPLAYIAQVRKQ